MKKNSAQDVFAHVTVGIQLALTIFIFVYGGYRLDLYFDKSPLFLAIGAALGMAAGFYNLMKQLTGSSGKGEQDREEDREEEEKKKVKWM